uniref:NADH-ubiquinone oxidoreductase chain 5 n=1 Tax=Vasticardium flavum TaxID=80826 RepID=A0A516IDI8_9BIVA|nr:NADH dehydrogenase subunit 5 [Vasticardium flavum]
MSFFLFGYTFFFLFGLFMYMMMGWSGFSLVLLGGVEVGYEFSLLFDQMGVSFSCVVALISGSVCLFSSFYMSGEVFKDRFMWLIGLFVGSMFILLVSGNMVTLMIGWDGLGLVSFLLVIYYESKSSMAAGMITVMMNRVGDVLFIVALALLTGVCVWPFGSSLELGLGLLLSALILVGSITKSAQIPFSSWLPAAMAAPTPVSTLVHSSTLVTAGLFVLVRFSSAMGVYLMSSIMGLLACFTCIMAGSCAVLEPDLKKVVALSTLSQLGVMGMALSVNDVNLAFFHLVVHALFKALMFMCVGCVIMAGLGVQEARYFSGLIYKMPVTSVWLCVSCASLSGFPVMGGFFSKDLLLEGFISDGLSVVGYLVMGLTCFFTGYYSLRLLFCVFIGDGGQCFQSNEESFDHVRCMSLLGIGSVYGGVIFQCILLEVNEAKIVSVSEKLSIMSWVIFGFFCFLLAMVFEDGIISGTISRVMWSFFGKMFYLSTFSGTPLVIGFFCWGKKSIQVESNMDFLVGSTGLGGGSSKIGAISSASEDHWAVWLFLFVYMVFVLTVISLTLLVF